MSDQPKVDLRLGKGCCQDKTALAGVISPFRRAVALEWWEGPVSGVAQCGKCSTCWAFAQVDHDADGVVRAFGLRRLPSQAVDQIVNGYGKLAKPSWHSGIWTPPVLDRIAEANRAEIERLEAGVFGQGSIELVIALKHLVNGRVLGACVPGAGRTLLGDLGL